MSSEHPRRSRVGVSPATRDQQSLLANLLELYVHDLSAFFDVRRQADGRFGYPLLPRYWTEQHRVPLLVHVDDRIAGFVLIARGSRVNGDPLVWDVSEFSILRRYRKQGIGTAVALEVWRRFPGRWEVRVLERNTPALAFWATAIEACTGAGVEDARVELQGKMWRVFSFVAQ